MPENLAPTTSGSRRCTVILALIAVVVLAVDQGSKAWALTELDSSRPPSLLGGFFTLHLVRNAGAAFSLATGTTWVFTLVALGVVVAIVRLAHTLRSMVWTVTLGVLLGGALGNLSDRLFREPGFARGHVIDFIDYHGWFVGNVADIAIVGGAALFILLTGLGIAVDGSRAADTEPGASAQADPLAAAAADDVPGQADPSTEHHG